MSSPSERKLMRAVWWSAGTSTAIVLGGGGGGIGTRATTEGVEPEGRGGKSDGGGGRSCEVRCAS